MKTLILIIALSLVGCASSPDYTNYLAAQSDANRLAVEKQKPLFRLVAQKGQSITGLERLEVYMPTSAPVLQQARPNEWVGVLGQGISVVGAVMGIKFAGDAATSLADSIGRSSTAGYSSIQAPAANVSTVTTTTTTDASNRSITDASVRSTTDSSNRSTTDASNRSVTTGAVSTITGSYNPVTTTTDASNRSTTTNDATSVPTVVFQPAAVTP